MVRMSISHTQACSFLETLITECGGNPKNVHLSINYSFRHRDKILHDASIDIKNNFAAEFPLGLHWDGKIMNDIEESHNKIERISVIVSDLEGNTQLIGTPKLPIGTSSGTAGQHIAKVSVDLLKEWNIQDLIATMNFDTTNTNTGKWTGACIRVQELIGRPLLWCACRKHVGEVHIGHAWDSLKVEASASPEISVYNIFKDNFHLISLETAQMKIFDINSILPKDRAFFHKQKKHYNCNI